MVKWYDEFRFVLFFVRLSRRKFSITARQYYFLFINLLSFKVQKDYNVL